MKSMDLMKAELQEKFSAALDQQNPEQVTEVLTAFAAEVQAEILRDYHDQQENKDAGVMTARGCRQLTTKETKFYKNLIEAVRTDDMKKAFEGAANAFPETVIDAVIEDIRSEFPLLSYIHIQNTATLTKFLVNEKEMQLAVWGPLGSKITEELSGAIGKIDLTINKLTAFMAISKDMLDCGPVWMDRYIRAVLVEACGAGLCKAVVIGTGKDQPIGMMKDVSETASVTAGVYPDKTAVKIADLSPQTIGGIAKTIAAGPNQRSRAVPRLLMVVNPVDYFDRVMPATTFLTPNGTYVNNVLPYPTDIVQDVNVPSGKAVFGLASRYFLGVGPGGAGGKIEYDDSVRFLDDERVYITKLYGNGRPLDENAFVVADISGLTPANLAVTVQEVKGTVSTKSQGAAS